MEDEPVYIYITSILILYPLKKSNKTLINGGFNMKRFYILLFLLVGLCYYFLWRNNQVFAYRNQLFVQRLWMGYDIHQEYIDSIEHRYTYMEMMFSFKPLKSRYWYTEEEIKKYQLNLVDEAM